MHLIVAESGEIFSICRVFADRIFAVDVVIPIAGGSSPAAVEIILLREIEGGQTRGSLKMNIGSPEFVGKVKVMLAEGSR